MPNRKSLISLLAERPYSQTRKTKSNCATRIYLHVSTVCPAFELARKEMGKLLKVSELRPAEYSEDAFTSLALPTETEKSPSSLIRLQKGDSAQFDDLVIEKGKGLAILLRGQPDVEKTFTAESFALKRNEYLRLRNPSESTADYTKHPLC